MSRIVYSCSSGEKNKTKQKLFRVILEPKQREPQNKWAPVVAPNILFKTKAS